MYTLYKSVTEPLCLINSELKIFSLKGKPLPESMRNTLNLMVDQVTREINPTAGALLCIDSENGNTITLENLVRNSITTKSINFRNPNHLKRIDHFRRAGLSEELVAEEFKTSEKTLYRNYPRSRSVSTSSTGRSL